MVFFYKFYLLLLGDCFEYYTLLQYSKFILINTFQNHEFLWSVAKRTDSSRTKSADSSTSCIGNKSSCINATPPVLEETSVQQKPAPAIPFVPEFTGTLDNSSLDCSGEWQSEEYGVEPTAENYHQLTDSPIFPQHDCLDKPDVSQDIEVMTHGQVTGANSNDIGTYGIADDQDTDLNYLEIPEQHLTLLNILEDELA